MTLTGWAVDPLAGPHRELSSVQVWAYPISGAAPIFMGSAPLDKRRPDVAVVYGEPERARGFELATLGLPAGVYDLAVFAWSDGRAEFLPAALTRMTVR